MVIEDHQINPPVNHHYVKGAVEIMGKIVEVMAVTVEAMQVQKDHHPLQAVVIEKVNAAREVNLDRALVMRVLFLPVQRMGVLFFQLLIAPRAGVQRMVALKAAI